MAPWLLALIAGRQARTETFLANATWVAPFGVSTLAAVAGKGAAGAPSYVTTGSLYVLAVQYQPVGSAGTGNVTWNDVQGNAAPVAADLNDGSATFTQGIVKVYPDRTNTVEYGTATINDAIPGTAGTTVTAGWGTSGAITTSGEDRVTWSYNVPATTGTASTAFGYSFPGGTGGPGSITTQLNVPVVGGNSYAIVVPLGGSVTITYYQ